ncbi:HupE/UreJ family protein [Rhizobium leguminosarum]|uniref:HupE/UreJ family protein n=1 Tax=Rhizobium leguminosarum TaxID=384 RepID=UPI000688CED4|nr:HupE/UreJ family protein [Rhizobium leguminosarum]
MRVFSVATIVLFVATTSASAHTAGGSASSFHAGLAHPISGLDHVTAMIAVGMLAAFKGGRALWLWPLSFVGMMVIGGVLGFGHVRLPYVEIGIAASVLILALMVVLSIVPSLWTGAALIAGFAILHGHAHGSELPHSANGLAFGLGFSTATIFLHSAGIGLVVGWKAIARSRTNVPVGYFATSSRKER